MRPVLLSTLFAAAAALGCGSGPPVVPAVEAPTEGCKVPEPPPATPDAAASEGAGRFLPAPVPTAQKARGGGPNLARLKPGARPAKGVVPGAPVNMAQIFAMRHPPSEMQWRALPPGSDAAIVAVLNDANEAPMTRARAADGLGVRGQTDAALRAVLADAKADGTVRRASARALSRSFVGDGTTDGARALIAALDDSDEVVREAVVRALAPHVGLAPVRSALEARRATEAGAGVKAALAEALGG